MRFKITIFDQSLGMPKAEVIEQDFYPSFSQNHALSGGGYGPMIKIELLMEVSGNDTVDYTQQN